LRMIRGLGPAFGLAQTSDRADAFLLNDGQPVTWATR
jgi:hypothetical protein